MRLLRTKRWSPEQISWHPAGRKNPLSHETIYRRIWRDRRGAGVLWQSLRPHGKRYNKRADKTAGRGIIPGRIDISCRPRIVDQRRRVGDWVGDTMLGCKRRGASLTIVERRTRMLKLVLLPQATAELASKAIVRRLRRIATRIHAISFDNGKAFAGHTAIGRALKARISFAKPYHAWERGANENANGLVRHVFPKGTEFSQLTHAQVAAVEKLLNDRPRKIRGFKSRSEVFRAAMRC